MFPLGAVLLPGEALPLQVFEPRYREMVEHCTSSPDRMQFGVVLISRGHEVGGGDQRTDVGTTARIVECRPGVGGRFLLGCVGERRIKVRRWLPDDPYPQAEVQDWPDEGSVIGAGAVEEVDDRVDELREVAADLARAGGARPPDFPSLRSLPGGPGEQALTLAARLPLGAADRLRVLSAPGPGERLIVLADALADVIAAARFRLAD
ncbi:hypothetical protein FK531_06905 [Rhodococcus spelaei]|uniref:Lon N-terminal domain-containing protein n=2 Tax=Rhodococcus spelaei TaxID=2546320 RepID=A0A541BN38_9NOCA|nr:hypothetical protein FK531_06905 [Rhodococcus spelaei]